MQFLLLLNPYSMSISLFFFILVFVIHRDGSTYMYVLTFKKALFFHMYKSTYKSKWCNRYMYSPGDTMFEALVFSSLLSEYHKLQIPVFQSFVIIQSTQSMLMPWINTNLMPEQVYSASSLFRQKFLERKMQLHLVFFVLFLANVDMLLW